MKQIWIWCTLVIFLGLVGLAMAQEEHTPSAGVMAPSLWVTPTTLDFTPVPVGQTGFRFFAFFNMGDAPLSMTKDAAYAAPFSGILPICATNLAPGSMCQIVVQFSPATTGIFSQTLQFQTDVGPFSVHVQGEGAVPPFYFNLLALDFGPVLLGSSKTLTVTITNQSLNTAITGWAGGGVGAPFSAGQNCASGLPAGDSCHFSYDFDTLTPGLVRITSTIETNEGHS